MAIPALVQATLKYSLSCAMDDAVHEFHILRENPIVKIKIPVDNEQTGKVQFYSKEQLDKFLDVLKIPQWLEVYKRPNVKPITYSVQERNVRLNIVPKFGHYKLNDITRKDYQKWINELRGHYSAGTVRRIYNLM